MPVLAGFQDHLVFSKNDIKLGQKGLAEQGLIVVAHRQAYADPDGHIWEPMWMDPAAVAAGPEAFAANAMVS